MNEKLEAAKFYLEGGFSVIPCQVSGSSDGKKELHFYVDWKEYQNKKPTVAELDSWWKSWPGADVAIVTGKISGITVVDTEKGADLNLFGLKDCKTVSAQSGGGGKHFYFAYTEKVKNRVRFAPLHDIRNDGGVIIAPPSDHPSGGKYAWLTPFGLAPLLPFPLEIIKAFDQTSGLEVIDWSKKLSEVVDEGSRNDTVTSVAGKLFLRFPEHEWNTHVWPFLVSWNAEHASPPLSERDLRTIFQSIGGAESRRRKTGSKVGEATLNRENGVFVVRIPIDDGFVVFSFDEPLYSRGDLEAIVKCHVEIPGHAKRVFESRLNVLSGSSCESYARQLTASFGKEIKWPLILSEAAAQFKQAFKDAATDDIFNAAEIFPERPQHLLAPFIEENAANMLFAKGGVGKTYISLRWALSLASGCDFLGSQPAKQVKTLFIDYENSPGTFKHRILTLGPFCPGFDEEAEKRLFYKNSGGIPLFEMKEVLRKFVLENGIGLLIVDSAAPACGGPPEDAAIATRYFGALRHIGITSLTIGHEAKADDGNWTFGSVFFTNLARNIWNLHPEGKSSEGTKHLSLIHKKFNNGPLMSTIPVKMKDQGVGLEYSLEDEPKFLPKASEQKVWEAIQEGATRPKEISDATGVAYQTVRNALQDLETAGKVEKEKYGVYRLKLAKM